MAYFSLERKSEKAMTKNLHIWMVAVACCGITLASQAQTDAPAAAPPSVFPATAQTPTAAELSAHLGGKVFKGRTSANQGWRLEFKTSGYVYANVSSGAYDHGNWRSEDGKLCVEYRRFFPSGCAEVRIAPQTLYYLRSTGEIITLLAD